MSAARHRNARPALHWTVLPSAKFNVIADRLTKFHNDGYNGFHVTSYRPVRQLQNYTRPVASNTSPRERRIY